MNFDHDTVDELPAPPRRDIGEHDFELLVLAARAINADFEEVDGEGYGNLHFPNGTTIPAWNPLLHSDDALDLVVRLRFTLEVFDSSIACRGVIGMRNAEDLDGVRHTLAEESTEHDPNGAARRAITRASAEIIRGNKFLNEIS
jgi:hypothetical protein